MNNDKTINEKTKMICSNQRPCPINYRLHTRDRHMCMWHMADLTMYVSAHHPHNLGKWGKTITYEQTKSNYKL